MYNVHSAKRVTITQTKKINRIDNLYYKNFFQYMVPPSLIKKKY